MWNLQLPLLAATLVSVFFTQTVLAQEMSRSENLTKNREIRSLRQIKWPITHASQLLSQSPPQTTSPIQVTGIRLSKTDKGIEMILETKQGDQLQPTSRTEANNLIIDIPNSQLILPNGQKEFRNDNPIAGITSVTVTQLNVNITRVTVTGSAGVPQAELFDSDQGLIFGLTPAMSAAQQPPTPQPPTQEKPTPENPPEKPSASTDEPIELVVTGEQDGYNVPDTTTATKTDTPLRDIPANIQVVPRQVLQEQKVLRLQDALRNVSGVNFDSSFGDRLSFFQSRGFGLAQFKNGFRDDFNTSRAALEFANIERLDVIKGPASVLYGEGDPGGLVNIVTKKPLFEPYYAADFTIGSYSFYRPTLDISGPLNSSRTAAYRLNLAYENAGSFRDFVDSERFFVAPALSWKLSPNTTLTFEGEYLHDRRDMDLGLVAIGDRPADLPFSRTLFDPTRPGYEFDEKRGYVYLDHKFNENLSIHTGFRISSIYDRRDSIIAAGDLQSDGRTLPLRISVADQFYETFTLQNDLIGKLKTGSISHTILFGFELARQTGVFPPGASARGASINIFNPVYQFFFPSIARDSSTGYTSANTIGVYLQDQITLQDNLKLLIGGRFDSVNSKENFDSEVSSDNQAFSPRVGVVYQPIPTVSLYANYSKSFTPQFARSADNSPFKPERGTVYEVGVKADFLNGRLSSILSAYDITKSNILTTDPNNPDFSIQLGEQQSRGIELSVVGEILPGWNIIAGYAYTDAKITEDNTFPVGNRLTSVPYNTANLWTKYTIQSGNLKGLGFGAGIFYVGNRVGDLDSSFELPSYARVDAGIYYSKDNFQAALNIKNLFDTAYFEGASGRTAIIPGAPLTILGTVSVNF